MLRGVRKPATIKLSESDDGRTLEARPGQEIELRLRENPTTGYRWRVVQEAEPVCQLLGTFFKAGTRPGEPGIHIRRYRVAGSGDAGLKLVYGRSWESAKTAARTFCLRVRSAASLPP